MRFDGKVALIAGSSRNLGKAVAYKFGKEGGSVIINAHSAARELEATAEEFRAEGINVLPVVADITEKAEVDTMVSKGIDAFGKIDCLVMSARVSPHLLRQGVDLFAATKDDWLKMQGAAVATMFLIAACLPGMIARRDGRILSIGGDLGPPGAGSHLPPHGFYARSGQELLRHVQRTYGKDNIRVNAIQPGTMETTRNPANYPDSPGGDPLKSARMKTVSLGRPGRPEELANVALFLLSDEASYLTGVDWPVAGGR